MAKRPSGKSFYMISVVAQKYNIHPQTLRLYEREGLLLSRRAPKGTHGFTPTTTWNGWRPYSI